MAGVARSASLLLAVLAQLFSQGLAAKLRTRSAGDPPEDNVQIKVMGNDEQNMSVEEIRELPSYKVTISEGVKEDWRTFEGIGALSAGASSRLLQDYPDEQRAEILDLLFKPKYGASLQVLKVEIGGDMQSTDGSEPSHMRFRGEKPDCTRGYEGWLVKEAKARNPAIRTYGLAWGVPGWIGNGTFFSQDNIKYHVAWLECMKATYSAEVDYIGIWNEMNWGSSWYVVELGEAIKAAGLSTKLVLLDAIHGISAEFLSQFQVDEKLQQLTAAVGLHYPCGEPDKARTQLLQTLAAHPATSFWASEELSTVADWGGAGCWGRMINQNFVRMQATSSIAWSLIWSAYPNLECFGNGLLYAFSPWSGFYEVMPPVWATAHTTQFTEPGWQYLPVGAGAGNLPEGGTFVTIASPDLKEFSIILETLTGRCMYHNGCFHEKEAESTQRLRLKLSPALAASAKSGALEVWATNETHWFAQLDDATVDEDGVLRTSMPVDAIVTITTRRGASKQGRRAKSEKSDDKANIPKASAFPLPFTEDFESRDVGRSPPFFSDQGGAFEVTEVKDESGKNKVLEQQVLQPPIAWIGKNPAPFSVFGSTNWTDVTFEASVNLGPQRSDISRAGPMAPFGHAVRISLLS
jgi:galactosylceramidase